MDVSEPITEFTTILQKSPKTYSYFNELRGLSPLSDVPDLVEDKIYHEKDATSNDQLREEIEE